MARRTSPSVVIPSALRYEWVNKDDRHITLSTYIPTPEESVRGIHVPNRQVRVERASYRRTVAKLMMLTVGEFFEDGETSTVHRIDYRCIATSPWDEENPTRGLQVPVLQMSVTPTRFLEALDHGDTELEIVEYLLRDGGGWADAADDKEDDEPAWQRLKRQRQQRDLPR